MVQNRIILNVPGADKRKEPSAAKSTRRLRDNRRIVLERPEETTKPPEGGLCGIEVVGDPYGIRTRVAAVKGRCPRPLDEGVGGAEVYGAAPVASSG